MLHSYKQNYNIDMWQSERVDADFWCVFLLMSYESIGHNIHTELYFDLQYFNSKCFIACVPAKFRGKYAHALWGSIQF